MAKKSLRPFLKWAGGKRQLLPRIRENLPKGWEERRYFEPFLGGGALLFDLHPSCAVINDINSENINVYRIIRDDVEALISHLANHENNRDYYYYVREMDRNEGYDKLTAVERASRIIYLNRTCYNGLFRVNKRGQFNVPFGKYKKPAIVNEKVLREINSYFTANQIEILSGDFDDGVKSAEAGDFIYLDPPYDPLSASSSFTGYTLQGFNRDEQIRLKRLCDKLDKKGCNFLLSNSATPFIKELYADYTIKVVGANRNINSLSSSRGRIEEVLVKNY
ncbi:MAG: DNA adenine methylase [Spirochaetales bacterium]|nr:DNA adenine methylase [Spirochaetales bacterium]